jgi:nucleoside-diphosphate-sugar epimerase
MRVFLTGATGFIGSAIVPELLEAGHQVTGLARSDGGAEKLEAAGADVHRGELANLDSLRPGAAAADGVIHCAFIHDFTAIEAAGETDRRAIETLGAELEDSGRPLVVTSGIGLLAPGRVGTELDSPGPSHRTASEETTLALASRGVRSSILRLPASVHGEGDKAFVPRIIEIARERRVSGFIGDGANRWPAVHRLDAARLFRLAVESAPPGTVLHGVGDEGIPIRDLAELIGRHLDVPAVSVAREDADEHFGWLATFLGRDIPASSALTRERFGWEPEQPGLIADLEAGHYFQAVSV